MFRKQSSLTVLWQGAVDDHVIGLAWSPDGSQVAVAAVSGPITIFEARTGTAVFHFKGHGFGTMSLSWHPNGRLLASSGQDGMVRLWDTVAGCQVAALPGGAAWVERVAWSPLSKQGPPVLASAAGRQLRFWDEHGNLLREFANAPSTIADIQWKPGKRVLGTAVYGGLLFYHPDHTEPGGQLAWKGSSLVLRWSPNGRQIATGEQDNTIHFWYVNEGRDLQMWGYPLKVRELAWDQSSRYLATGGGTDITVWDCGGKKGPEGSKPQQLRRHEAPLTALSYQTNGPKLASAGQDGVVAVWQPGQQRTPLYGQALSAPVSCLHWSPDDKCLAASTETGRVVVMQ